MNLADQTERVGTPASRTPGSAIRPSQARPPVNTRHEGLPVNRGDIMNYLSLVLAGALFLLRVPCPAFGATNELTVALQRGLFEEEANHNLEAAIQAYQGAAALFDQDRRLAATAIFRLGECYRKQGNTNAANTQYERVLREFSDQAPLVTLARQNLGARSNGAIAPAAAPASLAARREQKRLLEEELKILDQKLASLETQRRAGVVPNDAGLPTQQEILQVKRQIAALDVPEGEEEAGVATTTSDTEELKRIRALIQDSPDLLNAPDKKGQTLLQSAASKGRLTVVKLLLESGAAVNGLKQPDLTALHYAAANGHKAVVDLLLQRGAKAGAQTESGLTPLHLAALKGYEAVAVSLLAAGAPVNARLTDNAGSGAEDLQYQADSGQTPLHLAAMKGYAGCVKLLLAKGAEVNMADTGGRTALSHAVQKHFRNIVDDLLAAHANPNAGSRNLPLAIAAWEGDLPMLKLLLAKGAVVETKAPVTWEVNLLNARMFDKPLCSPLFLAVRSQHAEAVTALLQANANPNGTDPLGNSLTLTALRDPPTLKALLDAGANPNVATSTSYQSLPATMNRSSSTAEVSLLYCALERNESAAVELLLAHGAKTTTRIGGGGDTTVLTFAAGQGQATNVQLLLKYGADVNTSSRSRQTPLLRAVDSRNAVVVKLLLDHQADPNAPDSDQRTPLHTAVASGAQEIVQLLLEHKANPNARDRAQRTPLHTAVAIGALEIVQSLLEHQADPNARDEQGRTPLDLAKERDRQPPPPPNAIIPMIPVPGSSGSPLTYQWRADAGPGTDGDKPKAGAAATNSPPNVLQLLRQHGALDELPDFSTIRFSRSGEAGPHVVFRSDTNQLNHFTLLQAIARFYSYDNVRKANLLTFPDFGRIRIHRPTPGKLGEDQTIDVNLYLPEPANAHGSATNLLDPSKDLPLHFGDVVEIPEREHALAESRLGLTSNQQTALYNALRRKITVKVKGRPTEVTVSGFSADTFLGKMLLKTEVRSVLQSTSNLERVRVLRPAKAGAAAAEYERNEEPAWTPSPAWGDVMTWDDLWLEAGDVVEVPDRE